MTPRAVEIKVSPVIKPANSPNRQLPLGPMNMARLAAAIRLSTKTVANSFGMLAERAFSALTPASRMQALANTGPYQIEPTPNAESAATNIANQLTCIELSMTVLVVMFFAYRRHGRCRSCEAMLTHA